MKFRLTTFALIPLVAWLATSCSIENEFQESISENKAAIPAESQDPQLSQFIADAQQCQLGKTDHAISLLERFSNTLSQSNSSQYPAYLFQDPQAVEMLERCLRKSDAQNDTYLYIGYIPSSLQCAQIAQAFYAKGENDKGIFWLRRVVNQQGLAGGYELAGSVFIKDERTLDLGARLLSEAAKQGSNNARSMLMDLISGN